MITNTVCFPLCKNCVAWHFETLLIMAWHHAFTVIFKSHNSLLINYLLLTLKWITAYTVSWLVSDIKTGHNKNTSLLACHTVSLGNRPDVLKNQRAFILRVKLIKLLDHENECTTNSQNARITCPLIQHHTPENLNPQKYHCNDLKWCMLHGNEQEFVKRNKQRLCMGNQTWRKVSSVNVRLSLRRP
jgi:hypothetical protein